MNLSNKNTIEQEAYKVAVDFLEDSMWKYTNNVDKMTRLLVLFYQKGYDDSSKKFQEYIKELHCARDKFK